MHGLVVYNLIMVLPLSCKSLVSFGIFFWTVSLLANNSGCYRLMTTILMRRRHWAGSRLHRECARTRVLLPIGISWTSSSLSVPFFFFFSSFGCNTHFTNFPRKSYILKNQSNNSRLVNFCLISLFLENMEHWLVRYELINL